MIKLTKALQTWGTTDFEKVFKEEIRNIDTALLPLREGLVQTSYVSDGNINAIILNVTETKNCIRVKTGIFYAGIDAGSCCADDPTPVSEQTEYCEIRFDIDKKTAKTTATL